jgi:hypothetical protein
MKTLLALIAALAAMPLPAMAFGCVGQQSFMGCDGYAQGQSYPQPPPSQQPPGTPPQQYAPQQQYAPTPGQNPYRPNDGFIH